MVRLLHVYFPGRTLVLALSDGLLCATALVVATYVWFGSNADLELRYEHGILRILFASLVCVLCMYFNDLYDSLAVQGSRQVVTRLIRVLGAACIALAVIYYTWPAVQISRGPLLVWVFLVGLSLLAWRRIFVSVSVSVQLTSRVILLGDGPLAKPLAEEITNRPECGLNLVGYIAREGAGVDHPRGLAWLGTVEDLPEVVRREDISCVIVSMGERRGRLPVEELLSLKTHGVLIKDAPDLYEALTGKVPVSSLNLGWLLFSDGFRISPVTLFYKRVASLVLSILGLVITLPIMALISIAIPLDSRGPAIYRQKRVGKDGRIFRLFKFRSMHLDADSERPAQENDNRVTRVGRWLRQYRLDELPQLFNILRGDMCFVGPRPFIVSEERRWTREIPFYGQRSTVKPGITGWAQVRSGYCATHEDNLEKLGHDLYYVKNISPGLDLLILLHTVKILLLHRGAR
jgi:sugar transferase (PEP-CTERM system associated)